jgi:hypothetical protein
MVLAKMLVMPHDSGLRRSTMGVLALHSRSPKLGLVGIHIDMQGFVIPAKAGIHEHGAVRLFMIRKHCDLGFPPSRE